MNLSELKELFELISEGNITEFELEEEGVKLHIKKAGAVTPAVGHAVPVPTVPVPVAPASSSGSPAATTEDAYAVDGVVIVPAPMVGTFYRQPEPGAEPFASKGQQVQKGQTLCIIEAMKLMNEIESEHSGEIIEVFVEDGQSIQYGDRLFAIRES